MGIYNPLGKKLRFVWKPPHLPSRAVLVYTTQASYHIPDTFRPISRSLPPIPGAESFLFREYRADYHRKALFVTNNLLSRHELRLPVLDTHTDRPFKKKKLTICSADLHYLCLYSALATSVHDLGFICTNTLIMPLVAFDTFKALPGPKESCNRPRCCFLGDPGQRHHSN